MKHKSSLSNRLQNECTQQDDNIRGINLATWFRLVKFMELNITIF